jgi:hypothetical protein
MTIFFKTQTKFPYFTTKLIKIVVENVDRSPIRAYSDPLPKMGENEVFPCGPGAPFGSALNNPARRDPGKKARPDKQRGAESPTNAAGLLRESRSVRITGRNFDGCILSAFNPGSDPFDFYTYRLW